MKLTCPGCGLIAGAEAWGNDARAREALAAICKLPDPLPATALQYLSLFRPAKSALSWSKAHRLVAELAALVACGRVQVQGKVARPCPPRTWARAIEEMLARRERIERPMSNHNYLRQVAWGMADQEDAAAEKARDAQRANPYTRPAGEPETVDWAAMPEKEFTMLPTYLREKYQHLRGAE